MTWKRKRLQGHAYPADLREQLEPFYSEIGRPSIDPSDDPDADRRLQLWHPLERKLCEEVELHLAYSCFCRLDLDDKVPDHSKVSVNRHGRFRDSDLLWRVFEAVVRACMGAELIKGEVAIDASVMEADASRYHGKAPDEISLAGPKPKCPAVRDFVAISSYVDAVERAFGPDVLRADC